MPQPMKREELKRRLDEGDDLVVIEVLPHEAYLNGHIPGAVHIPLERIGHEAKQRFRLDQPLVVYCSSFTCEASPTAARKLEQLGFTKVWDFEGGKADWLDADYPVVTGPEPR